MQLSKAATKIQAAWRGFWSLSQFVIMHFELTRLQCFLRCYLARKRATLRLGSIIMIQAVVRRHLAKQEVEKKIAGRLTWASNAEGMRTTVNNREGHS